MTNENTPWTPVVAVPAKNEEARLRTLIAALARQTWLIDGRRLDIELVLNNCDDGSADVVRRAVAEHPCLRLHLHEVNLPPSEAHVGSARRLAMEHACARLGAGVRGVILTTDADATPHPDWIDANLRATAGGADAVGGLIIGDAEEEASLGPNVQARADRQKQYDNRVDRLAALIDPLPWDPWPRHRDHTGASLAIRANVYSALGGMPAVSFREDLAFVSRLRAEGYRLTHPTDVRVGVSARLDGRAPGGMAECLRRWRTAEEQGQPHLVEMPQDIVARLQKRRVLRVTEGDAAGQAIERWAADDPDAAPAMPVDEAIAELDQLIVRHEVAANAI